MISNSSWRPSCTIGSHHVFLRPLIEHTRDWRAHSMACLSFSTNEMTSFANSLTLLTVANASCLTFFSCHHDFGLQNEERPKTKRLRAIRHNSQAMPQRSRSALTASSLASRLSSWDLIQLSTACFFNYQLVVVKPLHQPIASVCVRSSTLGVKPT